ncbi:MAG TPA: TonB family protein [Nevskia sp.]|nr:TonB family protein [Nevskia sp.]
MSHLITWESWALAEEADRRFRRILLFVAIPAIIIAVLVTIFQMEVKKTEQTSYNGSRYAELVAEQPPGEQAPPEQPKPAPENKPEKPQQAPKQAVQKPQPTPVPQPSAREKAEKEMKVFDQLNDLRDQKLNLDNQVVTATPTLNSKGGIGAASSAESIANSAAATSGNGFGGAGSYTSSQSGTGLGSRRTGAVNSPVGFGHNPGLAGANGKVADARSLAEIQEVFDRNKGPLTSIYTRESRANPNMGDGKLVIRLTIAPDGSVTDCTVVSSSFNDPDFERKIRERILLFRFQAKNVPPFTYGSYPIEFHPM